MFSQIFLLSTLFFINSSIFASCEIASPLTQEEVSNIMQRNCMGRCHTLAPIQYDGESLNNITPMDLVTKEKIIHINKILSNEKFMDALPQMAWKGIEFKDWNKVDALFLILRGSDVFDFEKIKDFTTCKNVACLYNRSYELDDDHILGHQAWFYFLKTHYHIGARDFGSKKKNDRDLFEQDLLEDFVKLSFALPPEFIAIDTMLGHYRKQIRKKACGWYSNGNTFHKNCGVKERKFLTHFHHELAHAYDFAHDHISRAKDWKSLSGWQKLKGQWNHQEGEFSRRYGGKNPVEDFAVSVEAYRFRPHWMKKNLPQKYEFLKGRVFNNKEFLSCVD